MKLRVVGWTYYDDALPQGEVGWAAQNAIIDEIKERGYLFSGWAHQEADLCAPVLNDGKMYLFSQRGWGGVMAEAHGYTGRMDYAKFAFMGDAAKEIRPKERFDKRSFLPETDLNERFELRVTQEMLDSARHAHEIKLDDLPELRYLDAGDVLTLISGEEKAEYTVKDVDRDKDLSEEERLELRFAFYDHRNPERQKRAEEAFDRAKIILTVTFKPPKK